MSRVVFCVAALASVCGMLPLAENATAGVITLGSVPAAYGFSDNRVLAFDGSALSFANWSGNFAWQLYNDMDMAGTHGFEAWTIGFSPARFDASSSLIAGVSSVGPSSTPTQSFGFTTTSFSNRYYGLIYEAGGGNYNYGWANLSYEVSSEIATMTSAAMVTTVNQAVSVGVVPEPSTYALALAGLACGGFSLFRRRRAH